MENILIKIKDCYSEMNERDQKVAQFFLDNQGLTLQYSIDEIARECGTNRSAIVRFCQSLGLDGFKDFKKRLTADTLLEKNKKRENIIHYSEITENESISEITEKVIQNNIHSINDTFHILDQKELSRAIELLNQAPKINFYGIGASGIVALDAERKFIRIGKDCRACTDPHMQITLASNLNPEDVAVIISYTGSTKDILRAAAQVKKSGAHLIAVTKYRKNNPLSEQADIVLHISSTEWNFRGGSLSSRIASLTVIDILFLGVISFNPSAYDRKLFQNFEYADVQRLPRENPDTPEDLRHEMPNVRNEP